MTRDEFIRDSDPDGRMQQAGCVAVSARGGALWFWATPTEAEQLYAAKEAMAMGKKKGSKSGKC